MARKPEPWERQEKESSPAFEAFVYYRDMGVDRNLRAVTQRVSKSLTQIGKWSKRWKWPERCEAWDREYDQRRLEATTTERIKMEKRQIEQGLVLQEIARAELGALGNRIMAAESEAAALGKKRVDPVLVPRDLAKLLELGVKIERLSRGMSTDNVGVVPPEARQKGLQDLAKSAEARAELREVIRKRRGEG